MVLPCAKFTTAWAIRPFPLASFSTTSYFRDATGSTLGTMLEGLLRPDFGFILIDSTSTVTMNLLKELKVMPIVCLLEHVGWYHSPTHCNDLTATIFHIRSNQKGSRKRRLPVCIPTSTQPELYSSMAPL